MVEVKGMGLCPMSCSLGPIAADECAVKCIDRSKTKANSAVWAVSYEAKHSGITDTKLSTRQPNTKCCEVKASAV